MAANTVHFQQDTAVIARRECDAFISMTAFKALQFVKHSNHWTESILWVVLLAGATALAIRDVRKVCESFVNEETYTHMRVCGLHNLTLDEAIICVAYDARALNLSDPVLIESANKSKIIDLARRTNTSAIELLRRSLKLLTAISLIEIGRTVDYQRKVVELEDGEDLEDIRDWLKAEKVNISALSDIVGHWLCNSALIQIDTIKRGNVLRSENPCDSAKVSWLGVIPFVQMLSSETAMCLDIDRKLSFGSMLDRIEIYMSTKGSRTSDIRPAYIDFSGDPVSTDMTKDYIAFPAHGCAAFEIGIDAETRLLDRRVASCDQKAKTRLACFGNCEVLLYENTKECNCTQLTWSYIYAEPRRMCFDEQTIEQHVDCRRASKRASNTVDACWETCLFPCKLKQNGITPVAAGCYDQNERKDRASIELTPRRFTVPVFEEQFSVSISGLFSSIGGTCGLWLGVGVLGICHALLFPVKLMANVLRNSRVKNVSAGPGAVA